MWAALVRLPLNGWAGLVLAAGLGERLSHALAVTDAATRRRWVRLGLTAQAGMVALVFPRHNRRRPLDGVAGDGGATGGAAGRGTSC